MLYGMMEEGVHEHRLQDGTVLRHSHVHSHQHTHEVLMRMQHIIDELKSVRTMVENGCDCSDVLVRISSAENKVRDVGRIVLKDHMEHCVVDAVQNDDREALKKLDQALTRFMR